MTRFLIAAAATVGLAAADANAQWGTPPAPQQGYGPPPGYGGPPPGYAGPPQAAGGGERYGLNPILKKVFWWKKDSHSCAGCNGPVAPPYGAGPGNQMPGTLVFPNHPFARSPRDYFMQ